MRMPTEKESLPFLSTARPREVTNLLRQHSRRFNSLQSYLGESSVGGPNLRHIRNCDQFDPFVALHANAILMGLVDPRRLRSVTV